MQSHPFLAPAPAPLRTFVRCKQGPRRLAELDHVPGGAGGSRSPGDTGGSLPPPPPHGPGTPGGKRATAVRLAQLNPDLVRRLDEVQQYTDDFIPAPPEVKRHPDAVIFGTDLHKEVLPKFSLSMPAPREPWCRSSLGPPTPSGKQKKLPDLSDNSSSSNSFFRDGLAGALSSSHDIRGLAPLRPREEFTEERRNCLLQIEELQKQCHQLSNVVSRLQKERAAAGRARRATANSNGLRADRNICQIVLLSWRAVLVERRRMMAIKRSDELDKEKQALEEELANCRALQLARDAEAATRLAEVQASAEERLSGLEQRLRSEAEELQAARDENRAAQEAEAILREMAHASALRMGEAVVHERELSMQRAVLGAWSAKATEQRLRATLEAEATRRLEEVKASEAAAAAQADHRRSSARFAPEVPGVRSQAALRGCAARSAAFSSQPQIPRSRALQGGMAWAATVERAALQAALVAWRSAAGTRKTVGALQARLFADEASHAAAMVMQRSELDARFLEAEVHHRDALRRMRAELSAAEARHADVMAVHEAEAAQRMAAAEADFSQALRESGDATSSSNDTRVAEALRSLRSRANVRLAEEETRHAEELLAERESSTSLLIEAEKRHEESLQRVQEAADRRTMEAELRYSQALQAVQEAADQRIMEMEARHADLLCALEADEHGASVAYLLRGSLGSRGSDGVSRDGDEEESSAQVMWDQWASSEEESSSNTPASQGTRSCVSIASMQDSSAAGP